MAWFLFIAKDGDSGVGQCEFSPGIWDARKGVLFVVPGDWLYQFHRNPKSHSAGHLRSLILKYFDGK